MSYWKARFFTVWAGQIFFVFGSGLVSFSLIWWLTEKTGSTSVMAVSTFFTLIPNIALGPFAGALVDRFKRKNVMIAAGSSIALLTLFLMLLFYTETIQPWLIIMVMFLRETGVTFNSQSMTATTALMVPEHHLSRVNGMNQTISGIQRIAAPLSGALLISILPVHTVLSLDIAAMALTVTPLLIIPIPSPAKKPLAAESAGRLQSFWDEVKEGLRYVWSWKALFWVVTTCTFANVFLGPSFSFQPLVVTQVFGGGALELSHVNTAAGIGIITGGLLMSAWKGFKRRLFTSAAGWIGIGAAYMGASVIPPDNFFLFLVMIFIFGFMLPVGGAPITAFYQSCVPPDKQGRVFGVIGSLDGATIPLGLLIAFILGDILPLRTWYFLAGFSHVALGVIWLFIPFIRKAEDELGDIRESAEYKDLLFGEE